MKTPASFVLLAIMMFSATLISPARSQTADDKDYQVELQLIDDFYLTQKNEAAKPIEELKSKYRAALEKARADFQSAGNLEGVLAARRAIEELDDGIAPAGKSADPTIKKFETVFLEQSAAAEELAAEPLKKATQERIQRLEKLAVHLTKSGKIDEAVEVRSKLNDAKSKLAADTPDVAAAASEPVVKVIKVIYGERGIDADVTAKVREYIEVKRQGFTSNPREMGADPSPGMKKWLTVIFTKDGIQRKKEGNEGTFFPIEAFYGPQDADELKKWLPGTEWKSLTDVVFNADQTFTAAGRTGYRWSVSARNKIVLEWSEDEKIECIFENDWKSFTEQLRKKRTFRRVNSPPR